MIEVVNGAPEGYNKDFWKPANANGYTKHSNGGGLVSSKAKVDASVYVGPDAVVNGGTISGKARIEDFAVVDGGTISGNAVVRGRALVTAGTIGDDAVLEEDAWLVSGSITGKAKVGALSIIVNTTVTDDAQVYGVMWAVNGKKLSGTAQLRGDLENNFDQELTKGVFYGMVDNGMLNNANYGANLTTPPTDATASLDKAVWYAVADDSTDLDSGTTDIGLLPQVRSLGTSAPKLFFDKKEQAVFIRYKKNGREYRYRATGRKK
jgi:carbonic anhydrase/acetyltransferase-like protein (isoleucine patch superfamily)